MPTPSAISVDSFIEVYKEYSRSAQYAVDWANRLIYLVGLLQSDPNYVSALTPQEQAEVSANLVAAQQMGIVAVKNLVI